MMHTTPTKPFPVPGASKHTIQSFNKLLTDNNVQPGVEIRRKGDGKSDTVTVKVGGGSWWHLGSSYRTHRRATPEVMVTQVANSLRDRAVATRLVEALVPAAHRDGKRPLLAGQWAIVGAVVDSVGAVRQGSGRPLDECATACLRAAEKVEGGVDPRQPGVFRDRLLAQTGAIAHSLAPAAAGAAQPSEHPREAAFRTAAPAAGDRLPSQRGDTKQRTPDSQKRPHDAPVQFHPGRATALEQVKQPEARLSLLNGVLSDWPVTDLCRAIDPAQALAEFTALADSAAQWPPFGARAQGPGPQVAGGEYDQAWSRMAQLFSLACDHGGPAGATLLSIEQLRAMPLAVRVSLLQAASVLPRQMPGEGGLGPMDLDQRRIFGVLGMGFSGEELCAPEMTRIKLLRSDMPRAQADVAVRGWAGRDAQHRLAMLQEVWQRVGMRMNMSFPRLEMADGQLEDIRYVEDGDARLLVSREALERALSQFELDPVLFAGMAFRLRGYLATAGADPDRLLSDTNRVPVARALAAADVVDLSVQDLVDVGFTPPEADAMLRESVESVFERAVQRALRGAAPAGQSDPRK